MELPREGKVPRYGTSPEPKVQPHRTFPEPQSARSAARPRNPKVPLRGTSPEPWSRAEGCPGSSARISREARFHLCLKAVTSRCAALVALDPGQGSAALHLSGSVRRGRTWGWCGPALNFSTHACHPGRSAVESRDLNSFFERNSGRIRREIRSRVISGMTGEIEARKDGGFGKLLGSALPVVEGVQMSASNGGTQYDVSQTGTLVYVAGGMSEGNSRIVMVARDGSEQKHFDVKLAVGEMQLSPDGRRLALRTFKANDDIHILDMASGTAPRFTFEGGDEQSPVWTPDGSRVIYSSARGAPASIYWKAADGSGTPHLLSKAEHPRQPSAISPDGRFLLFTEEHPATRRDLWLMPLEDGSATQPRPWIQTAFDEMTPSFSPDGRWVAYASNESGETQIFVARFPDGSMRRQISTSGGAEPIWAANGREVFFRRHTGDGDRMQVMAVGVATEPVPQRGPAARALRGKALRSRRLGSGVGRHAGREALPPPDASRRRTRPADPGRAQLVRRTETARPGGSEVGERPADQPPPSGPAAQSGRSQSLSSMVFRPERQAVMTRVPGASTASSTLRIEDPSAGCRISDRP